MVLGNASEVLVRAACMFSRLLEVPPQLAAIASACGQAAMPRSSTPQGMCMHVCGWLLHSFPYCTSSCLLPNDLPPYELLKLSWIGSITSSGFKQSGIFRRKMLD